MAPSPAEPAPEILGLVPITTKTQVKRAARVFGRAFHAYPMFTYSFPDAAVRARKAVHAFAGILKVGMRCGFAFATSAAMEGVAVWLPGPVAYFPAWQVVRSGAWWSFLRAGLKYMKSHAVLDAVMARVHREHAPRPHLYLTTVGVDPAHQGEGWGGKLVRPVLERLDAGWLGTPGTRTACYLETFLAKNVEIYRRFGFEACAEVAIPGTGLTMWGMLRAG